MADAREVALKFTSDLPPDTFLPVRFHFQDQLNRPYRLVVELLSTQDTLDVDKLLGKLVQLEVPCPNDAGKRFLTGYVTRIAYLGKTRRQDREARYDAAWRIEARPWIALLDHGQDSKIHKGTVPEIVQQLFRDAGFNDFDDKLKEAGSYRTREFCVQYRESKMRFVHRLLEEEGIRYWHKLEEGKHTLVLSNAKDGHAALDGYDTLKMNPPDIGDSTMVDGIRAWQVAHRFGATKVTLEEYDFTAPSSEMTTEGHVERSHGNAELEFYDYPGGYDPKGDGETLAQIKAEELQADFERVIGEGVARGLNAGSLFALEDHPRDDQNREYVVVAYELQGRGPGMSTGVGTDFSFESTLEAVPSEVPWRPARETPRPIVEGPHTAEVVGSGDIWTDEYGRVKVQFHWDRDGQRDEESSCWCRVSQFWAGNGWGSMHLPHVGHEVIVEFLEGNPDRPIVTGRVYNGSNATFEPLPDNQEKSGFRDVAKNELIMTSTSGSEKIELRDTYGNELILDSEEGTAMLRSPTHESKAILGKSINLLSDSDLKKAFGGNEDTSIKGNQQEQVNGDVSRKILGTALDNIIGDASLKFGADFMQLTVGAFAEVKGGVFEELKVGQAASISKARAHNAVFGKTVNMWKGPTCDEWADRFKKAKQVRDEYKELTRMIITGEDDIKEYKAKMESVKEKVDDLKAEYQTRKTKLSEDKVIADMADNKIGKLKIKGSKALNKVQKFIIGDAFKCG